MKQKPTFVTDAQIVEKLERDYGLHTTHLQFLPVGEAAWCYRAETGRGNYFVKLVRHNFSPASLLVPNALNADFVNPALPDKQGQLWSALAHCPFAVYPYIEGHTAIESKLPDEHWREIGRIMASLHTTNLAEAVLREVRREQFVPRWGESVRRVIEHTHTTHLEGNAAELARFIRIHASEMRAIVARAEELGQIVRASQPRFVLCHGDPNQANFLLTEDHRTLLLDWDEVILAPAERDLMFFTGAEHPPFMQGYTEHKQLALNPAVIAYYKYEWVVQEFHDYGTRLFFTPDLDKMEQQHALSAFYKLFAEGDVVQAAYATEFLHLFMIT